MYTTLQTTVMVAIAVATMLIERHVESGSGVMLVGAKSCTTLLCGGGSWRRTMPSVLPPINAAGAKKMSVVSECEKVCAPVHNPSEKSGFSFPICTVSHESSFVA